MPARSSTQFVPKSRTPSQRLIGGFLPKSQATGEMVSPVIAELPIEEVTRDFMRERFLLGDYVNSFD
jgi:hypothetical protein